MNLKSWIKKVFSRDEEDPANVNPVVFDPALQGTYGIETIFAVTDRVFDLVAAVEISGADGYQITDAFTLYKPVMAAGKVLKNYKQALAEGLDVTPWEAEQITNRIIARLEERGQAKDNLAATRAVQAVMECVAPILKAIKAVNAWREGIVIRVPKVLPTEEQDPLPQVEEAPPTPGFLDQPPQKVGSVSQSQTPKEIIAPPMGLHPNLRDEKPDPRIGLGSDTIPG